MLNSFLQTKQQPDSCYKTENESFSWQNEFLRDSKLCILFMHFNSIFISILVWQKIFAVITWIQTMAILLMVTYDHDYWLSYYPEGEIVHQNPDGDIDNDHNLQREDRLISPHPNSCFCCRAHQGLHKYCIRRHCKDILGVTFSKF